MTVDRETLAAYAEGLLDEAERLRVEQAIAANPALATEVTAHQALRTRLQTHFAPVLDAPMPDRLLAALQRPVPSTDVVDLAVARQAKAEKARRVFPSWAAGGAIAASLAIGLVIGAQMTSRGGVDGGTKSLLAEGALDDALTTELAGGDPKPVRILLSLKNGDGRYCRVFEAEAMAGIACRDDGRWKIDRMQAGQQRSGGEFQQAGSALGDLMIAAQSMAPDGALDSTQEAVARDKGWK